MPLPEDLHVDKSKRAQLSANRQRLIEKIASAVGNAAFLRMQLQCLEGTMVNVAGRLENCELGITAANGISTQRRQVGEAIDEFRAAWHQLLLAWFAIGDEDGASISDLGQVLGVSEQLASRLAGGLTSCEL